MNSTKVSESNHAHSQKFLGKSLKPVSLSTFATKVFLSRICTSHIANGGDPKWSALSDRDIVKKAVSDKPDDVFSHVAGLGAGTEQPPPALMDAPADGVAVVPPECTDGNRSGDTQKKCGHLNPVMVAFNTRLKSAKNMGIKVDNDFRRQVVNEIKHAYEHDEGAKRRMQDDYTTYLRQIEFRGQDAQVQDKAMLSTFWGWGTSSLPLPVKAVQDEIFQHGLAPSSEANGESASDAFRVHAFEASTFVPVDVEVEGLACGAGHFNECRHRVLLTFIVPTARSWSLVCECNLCVFRAETPSTNPYGGSRLYPPQPYDT